MRKLQSVSSWSSVRSTPNASSYTSAVPIIQIQNGTFYRSHPTSAGDKVNIPMFPGLSFSLPSFTSKPQNWAILGASSSGKTTLLETFRGNYICVPPLARTFPFLSSLDIQHNGNRMINPTSAIQYIGFDGEVGGIGGLGTRGAYLSARYESHREETDFSVLDFLQDNTHLNLSEVCETASNLDRLDKVIEDFRLGALIKMPMGNLSNGQLRRARIAKAVLRKPEVLLLDEPFSMTFDMDSLICLKNTDLKIQWA